jgi:hypothetical protein
MKVHVAIYALLLVVVVATAGFIPGRAQETSQSTQEVTSSNGQAATMNWAAGNPLKIALLKWYPANQTTSFPVGTQPLGVAFDGANIWVTNNYDGTVTKLRANDGEKLGTFAAGPGAMGVAYDGANIWVANSVANTVTKLRASDGKNLGTFMVGSQPWFVAFDGANIWTTNAGDGTISKVKASDGTLLLTIPDKLGPRGIAFDGIYVWVTEFKDTVTRFKLDGKNAGTFTVGAQPFAVAFDGENIWVGNVHSGTVSKLRASDGKTLGTFPVPGSPYGIAYDEDHIWVTTDSFINELQLSDGKIVAYLIAHGPTGIGFDGANIWVAIYGDNSIFKL